ncbi:MAG: amidohydrolase family protein [Candidatus Binataceae bacterium]
MSSRTNSQSRSAEIRARLSHPIIDADGHNAEFEPLFLDYFRDIAGPKIVERYKQSPESPFIYKWHRMTAQERRDFRTPRPNWWGHPTSMSLDRATSSLPGLLHERLDELGLDFAIIYPSLNINSAHLSDEEMRRAACRAFNRYQSDIFREYSDRLTPVACIPMHTPAEALEELDYAVKTLGMKAILMPAYVRRPIPGYARQAPELKSQLTWLDTFCLDSEYDYDPVWARCVELKVAPTFHSKGTGFGARVSISNFTYNHIGHFAWADEAICKALFLGGVTRRFPKLHFAFQEGGIGWARILFGDLIGHWKIRNRKAIDLRNPALLDRQLFRDLAERYGGERFASKFPIGEGDVSEVQWGTRERGEDLDEFARCEIEKIEDIRDLFAPNFFFGCEGDDTMTPLAFKPRMNPFGTKLKAIYGSDMGHLDLPDMRNAAAEAYELVEEGLINEEDFRQFVFVNPVRLHGGMNPDFFKGTIVERAAAEILAERHGARE